MYYRCIQCNTAIESPGTTYPKKCSCGCKFTVRAERNKNIEQQKAYEGKQVYRSGGGDWELEGTLFIPIIK